MDRELTAFETQLREEFNAYKHKSPKAVAATVHLLPEENIIGHEHYWTALDKHVSPDTVLNATKDPVLAVLNLSLTFEAQWKDVIPPVETAQDLKDRPVIKQIAVTQKNTGDNITSIDVLRRERDLKNNGPK